jgi:hypothetical protein
MPTGKMSVRLPARHNSDTTERISFKYDTELHTKPGVGNLFMLEGRINLAVIK